jgi:hypothetical protein
MASAKKNPIPLITSHNQYPVPLTDRWGEFMDADQLERFWFKEIDAKHANAVAKVRKAHKNLIEQYGQTDMPASHAGDPRLFQHDEMSFVAHSIDRMGGCQLGIHAELELDTDDHSDELVTELAKVWQYRLDPLTSIYNHTTFFLAMGGMTYHDRLTLNAFTPLHNGTLKGIQLAPAYKQFMVSPYHHDSLNPDLEHCPMLAEITEVLVQMGQFGRFAIDAVAEARKNLRSAAA